MKSKVTNSIILPTVLKLILFIFILLIYITSQGKEYKKSPLRQDTKHYYNKLNIQYSTEFSDDDTNFENEFPFDLNPKFNPDYKFDSPNSLKPHSNHTMQDRLLTINRTN